jgi:eukaryotic-like serine/threonine-protein kinase
VIAGRYTLEREIGRGGAGIVHLARDEVLGRSVAIKRIGLLPGTTGHDVARAEREARLAAGINHPHVVSIFDLVKDDDCFWLVMEHVEGRTLAEIVAAEGPLEPTRAAGIIAQAADALVQANNAGIVHRDVKPSNIMVGPEDHAKLGDFGIARAASDAALTQTGLVTGSPAYLAPEVASGAPASAASDVWSLGGTLFHALVGRPPYDVGENVLGGLYKVVHDDPPRLPDGHPLAGLLDRMMVKDPEQRWPVARVRDDLRRVARGERSSAGGAQRPEEPADRGEATIVLGTPFTSPPTEPVAAPAPVSTSTRTSTPVPTPAVAPPPSAAPEPSDSRSRGIPVGWIAALLALVLVAGLGMWLLWPGDGERPDPASTTSGTEQTEDPSASEEPTEEPAEEPTEEPTEEATEEPTVEETEEPTTEPAPAGTRGEMQAFVQDYFATVTSDPESSFAMLTPEFQTASGGYERYAGFWNTISSATPSDIRADPRTLTTSYTIDYVTTSGRTTTEQGQLQLERQGDQYLIAGEG